MNVDWNRISNLYPNAWAVFKMQLNIQMGETIDLLITDDNRTFISTAVSSGYMPFLLDMDVIFNIFDKEGVFINIFCNILGTIWTFSMFKSGKPFATSSSSYPDRETANMHAIEAAFNYLERFYTIEGTKN